jgi:hypothetical protein
MQLMQVRMINKADINLVVELDHWQGDLVSR